MGHQVEADKVVHTNPSMQSNVAYKTEGHRWCAKITVAIREEYDEHRSCS